MNDSKDHKAAAEPPLDGLLRVGWWVVFDEPNDIGEIPFGFFITDERAKTFSREPGFYKNHLEPVYRRGITLPASANR